MSALMRAHDWSRSPLGCPANWPMNLKTTVGLMLSAKAEVVLFWGPAFVALYNDAYAPTIGDKHPHALGRPAREHWSELWDDLRPLLQGVRDTGQTFSAKDRPFRIDRHGYEEEVFFDVSYSPVMGETGGVDGVLCIVSETTDKVLSERRLTFLVTLADKLRPLDDPEEIQTAAVELIGRSLKVGRAGYAEVDETETHFTVARDWTDGSMASLAGAHPFAAFGPRAMAICKAGKILRIDDVACDPVSAAHRDAFDAISMAAGMAVPLLKDGRFTVAFYVHSTTPRHWLDWEVLLVQEAAERTWTAVERARAEIARLQVEKELRESEQRFQAIVNSIDQMIWSTRPDGFHDYYNDRWYEFTGLKRHAVSGEAWGGTSHPDDKVWAWERWRKSLATGEPFHIEYRLRHHSGEYRWIIATAQCVRDSEGRITRWYGTCTDVHDLKVAEAALRDLNETLEVRVTAAIAEREEAESALRQAQKMEAVGQLTGGIAHDFNNLLQIITGNLEVLQRRLPDDEGRLKRAADNAMTGAARAATLTHRLLAFSRRQPLAPKPLDLNALVAGMAEMLTGTLGDNITLEALPGAGLWKVEADFNQLESAILNLAVNARDSMPDGGGLRIETSNAYVDLGHPAENAEVNAGQYVMISVSDSGIGMDEATAARAFEPFFTTKEVGKGTGLGLSMVYGFVRQSGGHVRIQSRPGEGTTVRIFLPRFVGDDNDEPAVDEEAASRVARSETILVVEDDDVIRLYSVECLRELGYRVIEAGDAQSALRLVERRGGDIDLLFSDIVLPGGINGEELSHRVRALWPDLKVLFTTGFARDAVMRDGRLDTGVELITKPFTHADLAARVRDVLDGVVRS